MTSIIYIMMLVCTLAMALCLVVFAV